MTDDLEPDLRLALDLADLADTISVERFRASDLVVSTKPDLSPVTDADKAVESAIRDALEQQRPQDSVYGEEFGTAGSGRRQWIVDPIDGTKNFVRGVPIWATLIALAVDGVPVVGVVSAPALARRWWAAQGLGAYVRNGGIGEAGASNRAGVRRIQVSQVADLGDASIACSGITRWEQAGKLEQYLALCRRAWRTRDFGDAWPYMMVAEGLVDVAGEYELQPYDMAALVPIVREAGGSFTSVEGEPDIWHGSALATNGLLHAAALHALA